MPMPVITKQDLELFSRTCLEAAGCRPEDAAVVAEILVAADLRAIYSHGVNRLEMYVHELRAGDVDPKATPTILTETTAVACVNGNNGHGMVVGRYCMELAIRKAAEVGVGWVVARSSNHFGITGYYAMMAADQGMIGLSFTNTSPLVVPTRAKKPALGTNALAAAAPARKDRFVLDMATSTVAIGKVEMQHRKGEAVPPAWGVDAAGQPTTNPAAILDGGALLPLGGGEETAGYKGYGLAALVEIFCGVLAGAAFGLDIPPWRKGRGKAANLGQCFVAIDPSRFGKGFEDRLATYLDQLRSLPPIAGETEVLIPGDPEKRAHDRQIRSGIELHPNVAEALKSLAADLGVHPPRFQGE
jgi:LDH2 family malate/lactate/ureidoglycolate dehydrogenase